MLEEDICMFRSKGHVFLKARAGKSKDVDNVFDMSKENICDNNGNLLIELLQTCNRIVFDGRTSLSNPQWT